MINCNMYTVQCTQPLLYDYYYMKELCMAICTYHIVTQVMHYSIIFRQINVNGLNQLFKKKPNLATLPPSSPATSKRNLEGQRDCYLAGGQRLPSFKQEATRGNCRNSDFDPTLAFSHLSI